MVVLSRLFQATLTPAPPPLSSSSPQVSQPPTPPPLPPISACRSIYRTPSPPPLSPFFCGNRSLFFPRPAEFPDPLFSIVRPQLFARPLSNTAPTPAPSRPPPPLLPPRPSTAAVPKLQHSLPKPDRRESTDHHVTFPQIRGSLSRYSRSILMANYFYRGLSTTLISSPFFERAPPPPPCARRINNGRGDFGPLNLLLFAASAGV